jgi:hypothetical protein
MNKTRIALLSLTFIIAFLHQPSWVYENFWSKAEFYDSIPFTVPYIAYLIIFAMITTSLTELLIRFVKKYA